MLYGASLGAYLKKSFQDKSYQTTVNKIIETLPIDPAISNMDAVVLGAKDFGGTLGRALLATLKDKHPDITIVYIYVKDKEKIDFDQEVSSFKVAKLRVEEIYEAVLKAIELKGVNKDSRVLTSNDEIPGVQLAQEDHVRQSEQTQLQVRNEAAEVETSKEVTPLSVPEQEAVSANLEVAAGSSADIELPVNYVPIEERIGAHAGYADWDLFQESLKKDSVVRELLVENSQYAGVLNMLEVLDRKITNIFRDPDITPEDRFQKIREVGLDRSAYKGIQDNIIADKVISIMSSIVNSANKTVDIKIENIRKALDTLTVTKELYNDQSQITSLINARLEIQSELLDLAKNIIEIYKTMDSTITELVQDVDKDLPSSNPYISEMLKPIKHIFTPSNAAKVTSKLMYDLQQNRVSLSALESKIQELIGLVFKLCEADDTIIDMQQKMIELLQSQRVEDVVILDTVIKHSLRLYIGTSDTGRTATALTWAGILSRRQNTLLIDLSGSSKFKQYGVEAVTLDDFLRERIERSLVCVEGDIGSDIERVEEIVSELKGRLNYYPYVNIILDSSQVALMNALAKHALAVHFITNSTLRANKEIKIAVEALTESNIARKVILIDPPVDAISILRDINIDPMLVKMIILPRLQSIAAASLKGRVPYEDDTVVEVFEEVFR